MDQEIEVFRADTRASRGITADRLASLATFDCEANPIGLCIGHPESNTPAHGTIAGFRLDGTKLYAKLKGIGSAIIDGVKAGELINRSMAFFHENDEANPTPGKLAPRHLGFLGASAPGIPGMEPLKKALAFAAEDTSALLIDGPPAQAWIEEPAGTSVIFTAKEPAMSGTPTPTPTPTPAPSATPTADELAFKAREDAFAKRVRQQFEASNGATIDGLVREGKVLPAEAADLKIAFNALDPEGEELTFGAGDKTSKATAAGKLLAFMAGLPKRVPLGDQTSPKVPFEGDAPKDALSFNARVKKLAEEKGLTFDAAAEQLAESLDA